jgi:hypothetical protein
MECLVCGERQEGAVSHYSTTPTLQYPFRLELGVAEQGCRVIICLRQKCGCSSVVEHLLAKEDVASSSLVTRSSPESVRGCHAGALAEAGVFYFHLRSKDYGLAGQPVKGFFCVYILVSEIDDEIYYSGHHHTTWQLTRLSWNGRRDEAGAWVYANRLWDCRGKRCASCVRHLSCIPKGGAKIR